MDRVGGKSPTEGRPDLALRVAGAYAAFATLWILVSSRAAALIAPDAASHEWFEILKGLAFVLVSALLIFGLVRAAEQRRMDAERRLREDEERQRLLLGAVRDHALYLLDPDGRVLSWNPGAERVKGWSAAEVLGESWDRFFTAEEQAAGRPIELLRIAATEGEWRGETVRQRRDGTRFEAEVTMIALSRPDGSLYGFAEICHDLTDPRSHDAALHNVQSQLARVQAHARIGYWTRDLADDRLELSDSLHQILGVPRDQWGGNFAAFFNLVHPEDRTAVGRAIQAAYEGSGAYDIRFRVQRPDGSERTLDAMGRVEFDATGRPIRVWGTALDISSHVRAQQAVEHSRAQLAGIVGSAMDAIITVDAAQRIVQFNTAAEQMFGMAADRAIGTRLDRFIPLDARAQHAAHIESFAATGVSKRSMGRLGQVRGVRIDGREFPAEASISQLTLGEDRYFTVIMRDITERARSEQQLHQNAADLQRLSLRIIQVQEAERRHIARELHDEIGQTLTAAKLSVQQQGEGPGLADTIAALDHVLQQVRALSLDLRPSMLDDLGLPATLRWLLGQQGALGRFATALELEGLDERLAPDIETTAFRIVQEALTNVQRHAAAQRVTVRLARRAEHLHIEIQDDGLGFDPRERSLSFGLQGMRERATLIGGEFGIDSAPGRGTTVRARLPSCMPDTEVMTP